MKKIQVNNNTVNCVNKYSKTNPINIPTKLNKKIDIQEVKINLFDPDKFSPPSSWKNRLSLRVLNM